jgi:hypothetical protein
VGTARVVLIIASLAWGLIKKSRALKTLIPKIGKKSSSVHWQYWRIDARTYDIERKLDMEAKK